MAVKLDRLEALPPAAALLLGAAGLTAVRFLAGRAGRWVLPRLEQSGWYRDALQEIEAETSKKGG